MTKRKIGPFAVEAVGLGAMSLSHAYEPLPSAEEGARLLRHALDIGVDFIDTATLYGFGANEELIGATLGHRRDDYVLASKCGLYGQDGKRGLDGRPEALMRHLDDSLRRLRTDRIDLYYLHRRDFAVPIEDSVGALGRMVEAGKIRAIGLSEVSGETIRIAHAVYPIAAVQNEYSPWSRESEIGALAATAEIGAAFVAFSPVGRGFLADAIHTRAELPKGDFRLVLPRLSAENLPINLAVLDRFRALATDAGMTPAQLAIAWGLAKAPHVISIPGTSKIPHLDEDFAARSIVLAAGQIEAVEAIVNRRTVAGPRYPASILPEIDTEQFADA